MTDIPGTAANIGDAHDLLVSRHGGMQEVLELPSPHPVLQVESETYLIKSEVEGK